MSNQQQAIIIRKKKKGGHGGHHGGAWKVAYADFVTAMMSFFLLLWLLQTTTSDQRRGLADYFAPASISDSNSGAGGALGGMTLTVAEGAQASSVSPPAGEEEVTPTVGADDHASEVTGDGDKANVGKGDKPQVGKSDQGELSAMGAATEGDVSSPGKEYKEIAEAIQKEESQFKGAEEALKTAIAGNAELSEFADQILVDRTSEGLRIQIVDKERSSMFPSGSAIPYERSRDLLRLIGKIIARLPNKISITGHTDSSPFPAGARRDNWGLSTDRANTSRMEMVAAGVPDERVARMVGMSDREPLVANDPKNAKNRRISIVLLRQATAGNAH